MEKKIASLNVKNAFQVSFTNLVKYDIINIFLGLPLVFWPFSGDAVLPPGLPTAGVQS